MWGGDAREGVTVSALNTKWVSKNILFQVRTWSGFFFFFFFLMVFTILCLGQWFSNLRVLQNPLEGPTIRVPDLVEVGWGPEILHILIRFPDAYADATSL